MTDVRQIVFAVIVLWSRVSIDVKPRCRAGAYSFQVDLCRRKPGAPETPNFRARLLGAYESAGPALFHSEGIEKFSKSRGESAPAAREAAKVSSRSPDTVGAGSSFATHSNSAPINGIDSAAAYKRRRPSSPLKLPTTLPTRTARAGRNVDRRAPDRNCPNLGQFGP